MRERNRGVLLYFFVGRLEYAVDWKLLMADADGMNRLGETARQRDIFFRCAIFAPLVLGKWARKIAPFKI